MRRNPKPGNLPLGCEPLGHEPFGHELRVEWKFDVRVQNTT
jgi:hypothetical protein